MRTPATRPSKRDHSGFVKAHSAELEEPICVVLTGENIAREALRLLTDSGARAEMKAGLAEVKQKLAGRAGAPQRAAALIQEILEGQVAHVS